MKHFILILSLIFCVVSASAQEMSVQSFALAETDLTANTPGTMKHDQNSNVAALIKVETTQKGFTFDVGMLGVIDVVEHPAEIWVYVPFGIRKMTIQHPQLGILRDYQFPCSIEKGRTYIMKLTAGTVRTVVEHTASKQFLQVRLNPSDAILEINGKVKATDGGVYEELLPFGRYQFKAYRQDYHDLDGVVEISDPDNIHSLELKLRAAFGYLSVLESGQPEIEGASVYVDERFVGQIPVRNVQLASGSHRLRVIKEMYESYNSTFTLSDEENKQLTPSLVPDFAEVSLVTDNRAEIYINGDLKGKGSWTGRLASGSYIFESHLSGHIPYKMSHDITRHDQSKTIRIQAPTPIYGSLVISSSPSGAKISINGQSVGQTPKYIANQVIGQYTVTAEMDDYETQTQMIEVTEGAEASLAFTMEKKKDFVLKVKGVEYPMVFVDGGTFMMGSDDSDANVNEKPGHKVTLSSFTIGKYEVTQELWEAVMGASPSRFKGPRKPVESVSWNDCQEFIRKLNALTGMNFKLPTEAQWEFAARGGNKSRGYKYSGSDIIDQVGWYDGNSGNKTHKVGTQSPNELGIYDMSGNVWEWCNDVYGIYLSSSQNDPTGPDNGSNRVFRGGAWYNYVENIRVSTRRSSSPYYSFEDLGFRLCL